jgi:hypothetical protein
LYENVESSGVHNRKIWKPPKCPSTPERMNELQGEAALHETVFETNDLLQHAMWVKAGNPKLR